MPPAVVAHSEAEQRIAEARADANQQVRQVQAELQAAETTIARTETEADQAT